MKKIIQTKNAPATIGPYSQAVAFKNLIFCSGQIALNPQSGEFFAGNISEQTEQVIQNLKAVLTEAGSSLDKILQTTVYLKNMSDFTQFNLAYAKFFPSEPPARATIGVAELPKGALVEISAIAII